MVDSYVIGQGDLVSVTVSDAVPVKVTVTDPDPVHIVGLLGPIGPTGPKGSGNETVSQVISGSLQNGVTSTFTLSQAADIGQAVQLFRNGLLEIPGIGYTVTQTSVTLTTPPLSSDVVAVIYQKVTS
jgi:hypothetical protein